MADRRNLLITIDKENTGELSLRVNGKPIHMITYVSNMKIPNSKIKKFCDGKSIELYEDGQRGTMCINADYNIGSRTGKRTEIGQPCNVYDPSEWECYEGRDIDFIGVAKVFRIIWFEGEFVPFEEDKGGASMFNDCLYLAIAEVIHKFPKDIDTPLKLKKFLGLEKYDRVSIDLLYKLEDILNASINVNGDFIRISQREDSKNTINLYLQSGHYTINYTKKSMNRTSQVYYRPKKKNAVLSYSQNKNCVNVYDGEKLKLITIAKFREMRASYAYIFLKSKRDKEEKTRTEYIESQKLLKSMLDINMFKYSSYSVAAMDIWKSLCCINEPEAIMEIEDNFLSLAFKAGVRYAEVGYIGPSYLYDINSMYPSMMIHRAAQYPIKAGQLMSISELGDYPMYGIYLCKINGEHKLWTQNQKNVYTHYDLLLAKVLGLEITLIHSRGHNFYYYDKDSLSRGDAMFGNYINKLYPHKKTCKPVKLLLNSLWGSLAKRNHQKTYLNIFAEGVAPDIRTTLEFNIDFKTDLAYFKHVKPEELSFATNYARVGVFLTSFARYQFAKMVLPYADAIVRILTDSIITNVPITTLPISSRLGEWKIEHEDKNIKIINKNKYIPV